MKSLYSILGVRPDATPDQIEVAYAELLTGLQEASATHQEGDHRIKLIAAKEAYSVLSDPVARQRYNNKLFATDAVRPSSLGQPVVIEAADSSGMKKILLVGAIVLAGIGLYSYNAREREQLRLQHEREVQMKALQLAEEKQLQMAAEQEARLERQKQMDADSRERAQRYENDRYLRDFDARQRVASREEEQRQQREKYEKQRQEREEASKRNREMTEAQRRVMKDKMDLQQIERERYGRVITR